MLSRGFSINVGFIRRDMNMHMNLIVIQVWNNMSGE